MILVFFFLFAFLIFSSTHEEIAIKIIVNGTIGHVFMNSKDFKFNINFWIFDVFGEVFEDELHFIRAWHVPIVDTEKLWNDMQNIYRSKCFNEEYYNTLFRRICLESQVF